MKKLFSLMFFIIVSIYNVFSQDDVEVFSQNPRVITKISDSHGGFYHMEGGQVQGGLIYTNVDSTLRYSYGSMPDVSFGLSLKTLGINTGHFGMGMTPGQHYLSIFHNSQSTMGPTNHPDNSAHLTLIEDDPSDYTRIWFLNAYNNDRWALMGRSTALNNDMSFAFNGSPKLRMNSAGRLTLNNEYTFPNVDGDFGDILVSDGLGNLTWSSPSGDNLGNHMATQVLKMGFRKIVQVASPQFNSDAANKSYVDNNNDDDDADPNNEIQDISIVGNQLSISNGSTITLSGGSDDLGNHQATQNLNMSANAINDASSIDVNGKISIGDDNNSAVAGHIRWNSSTSDFEGYNGSEWVSFTKQKSWGINQQNESLKIGSSDGAANDYFGNSVSISGDYAVVGAFEDDDNGASSGSAYIFYYNGGSFSEQAKLSPSDGAASDHFGWSVYISGDYAIIGAKFDNVGANNNQGSAYVFHRSGTTWTQQAKLTANDGTANDYFGWAVSISDDYAVIGAYNDNVTGLSSGSAYVFHRSGSTWAQETKLSEGVAGDKFGYAASISGDYVVIGAQWDDISGNSDQGSAYVYHRVGSSWTLQTNLISSDGAANNYFGSSVGISGDYVVVGAFGNDEIFNNCGSAYIFHRSGTNWTQQAKLNASDKAADDNFGISVNISGSYVMIGAYLDDVNVGVDQGSAYIFHRSGSAWNQQTKLTSTDGAEDDYFGYGVGFSSDHLIISAYGNDDNGSLSGSIYFYEN